VRQSGLTSKRSYRQWRKAEQQKLLDLIASHTLPEVTVLLRRSPTSVRAMLHRLAISNSRLVALANGHVTFRWRDSAHGNQKRLMTLPVDEFLRRFLLHLLPRGFMRIRNFGFLANRRRAQFLPLCLRLLQSSNHPAAGTASPALPIHSLWQCPLCGGTMQVVERLSAAQLLLRSPPHLSRFAV
jgi:hypothetical protein